MYSCFLNPTHVIAGYRATGDSGYMQIRNQISKNNTRARSCYVMCVVSLTSILCFLSCVLHNRSFEIVKHNCTLNSFISKLSNPMTVQYPAAWSWPKVTCYNMDPEGRISFCFGVVEGLRPKLYIFYNKLTSITLAIKSGLKFLELFVWMSN